MADGGGEASQAPLLFDDSMDIEAYASRYNGRTRLARLLFVAQWYWEDDTKLKALQMAHDEAKEREDTMLYCEAASRINGRLGPLYEYDEAWVYSTKRLVADAEEPAATWTCSECSGDASSPSTAPAPAPTASGGAAGDGGWADLLAALRRIDIDARLSDQDKEQRRKELIGATVCAADATADADEGEEQSALEMVGNNFRCVRCLKRAASMQVSLIEDRIRMSYNEIGDFYYTHGHLDDALKSYKRMNDYSTAPEHILGSYMHIILVYIELGQFQDVLSCVKKAENFVDPLDTISDLKLQTAAALAYMETWQYECAAKKFIEITPALESNYSEVIAPEDAAIYGALCALASFDRSELKSKVIENMNFRNFLEQVPEVRNLVKDFYSRHHQSCLKHLEKLQPNLILDIRLHEHLDTLYKCIHRRMLKAMKKAQKVSARLAYLDLACFHDDVPGPDHLVYMAHLAGRPKLAITGLLAHLAGRFHDVLEQLSTVAESGTDISQKELELYHESYASVLESKLQVIKIFENKLQMNSNDQFLVSYLKKFRMELEETCTAGVKLAEEYLLPAATKQETARVCHNLMAASFYYRFTAELDMKKKNEALSQYLEAKDAASKLTPPFEEGSRTPFEEGSEIPSEEGSEISFEEDATIPFRLYPGQQLTLSNLSSSSDSEGDTAPEVWAADLRKPRS